MKHPHTTLANLVVSFKVAKNPTHQKKMAYFNRGDKVEVCSKQEGFVGSYYEGTVVAEYRINNTYAICYKDLLTEDESHALIEVVGEEELRPVPPKVNMAKDDQFVPFEEVDAFDNDGWWVGKISGRKVASKYNVFFDVYGVEILYPSSQLRPHLEWIGGQWASASPSRERMF